MCWVCVLPMLTSLRWKLFQGLDDIPVGSLTHLYFSFGSITPGDYSITGMDGLPEFLFTNFTNLKKKNPALKTVIALGGWTFNDPGMFSALFPYLFRLDH